MRNGEFFARAAKASAESMEEIAAKTERDTGSMHGITVLTFVFLPGTFVSVRAALSFSLQGSIKLT